jgi:hypothetical protein
VTDNLTLYASHYCEVIVPFSGQLFAPCLLRRVWNSERFGHCLRGGVDEVHGFVIFRFAAPDDQVTQADSPSSLAAYLRTSPSRPLYSHTQSRDAEVLIALSQRFRTSLPADQVGSAGEISVLRSARGELCNKLGRWYQKTPL